MQPSTGHCRRIHWHDGEFIHEENLRIRPFTPGFEYGAGYFTTLKASGGRPCFLPLHLQRLYASLNAGGMEIPDWDAASVLGEVLSRNGLNDARIKIMAYESVTGTAVLVKVSELPLPKAGEKGLKLLLNTHPRADEDRWRHKSMNYQFNLHSHRRAQAAGADDMLFSSADALILESCFSNVFLYRDQCLYTAPLSLPLLPGTARHLLLEKAPALGLKVLEEGFSAEELLPSDSLFLCNAVRGLQPVQSLGEATPDEISFRPLPEELSESLQAQLMHDPDAADGSVGGC